MNPIFPTIAIFIFVLILFLVSQVVVKIIWDYKKKFNSTKTIENLVSTISLFFLFIILLLALFSVTNIFISNRDSLAKNSEYIRLIEHSLNVEDCQELINKIYLAESQIYNLENHRYLENFSNSNNVNADYKKGAEFLEAVANRYLSLDLNPESKYYSQLIANKLQEKAQLFIQRSEIIAKNKDQKKVKQLLDKMDLVTQERLKAIASVEDQCSP